MGEFLSRDIFDLEMTLRYFQGHRYLFCSKFLDLRSLETLMTLTYGQSWSKWQKVIGYIEKIMETHGILIDASPYNEIKYN